MKKKALLLLIVIGAFCLSGCKRIELEDDIEDAYIEYAVNAVINHDKNNMLKMESIPPETEEESKWISDDEEETSSSEGTSSGTGNSDGNISQITYVSFTEALGIDGITVSVNNIKECDMYPQSAGGELGFAMTASKGSRLVVLEIGLTNSSTESITVDTTKDYAFKGNFNGIVRTNALMTLFDYSLNNKVHTIAPGETKDAVLIYELSKERVSDIQKIVVSVSRDSTNFNVSVK